MFGSNFRILDISSGENIQFFARNPIFGSKSSNFSLQRLKFGKNYFRKSFFWFDNLFFGLHARIGTSEPVPTEEILRGIRFSGQK